MSGFSSTEKDDAVFALLEGLIPDFDTGTGTSGRAMRQLLSQEPVRFCTAAVRLLNRNDHSPGSNYLLQLLVAEGMLVEQLGNPSAMSLDAAIRLAQRTSRGHTMLDAMLAERILRTDRGGTPEHCEAVTTRILELLASIPTSPRILPVLMQLLHRPNPWIRSKAIMLLVRSRRDERWISQVLSHADWRIRANAIEALWLRITPGCRPSYSAPARIRTAA
ncbi:MAG: HEAT repeat domain-containing protein [Bryobacteraceae bacterium]